MSFNMCRIMTRIDQLCHIAEATGSKFHIRELEAEAHSQAKASVLALKQYHAHYYRFYEKGQAWQWWVSKA